MSDVRARLVDALRKHRQGPGPSCRCCGVDYAAPTYTDHLADALLALPGIAIVDTPPPISSPSYWDDSCQGAWPVEGEGDPISLWPYRPESVAMPDGDFISILKARSLAAALLAAANAAESVTK